MPLGTAETSSSIYELSLTIAVQVCLNQRPNMSLVTGAYKHLNKTHKTTNCGLQSYVWQILVLEFLRAEIGVLIK